MLFTSGAVQILEPLQKEGGIQVGLTSIEGRILFSSSGVGGCKLVVQQWIVLVGSGRHCVIKASRGQGTSCAT